MRSAPTAIVWLAVAVMTAACTKGTGTRGVSLVGPVGGAASKSLAGKPAALFVGVQRFTSTPPPADVEFAVDDAVDLAAAFAERIAEPARIALALAGAPHKESSKAALQKLRASGARVEDATKETVERLLAEQAALAGSDGELIVSFATHGFSEDGVPYVLASNSSFEDHDSAISAAKVLDVAASAGRSVIFLDACRDRTSATRGGSHRFDTKAPLLRAMKKVDGQVVFSIAAGKYTVDDRNRRNGVFTGAIIDGLQGKAKCVDGYITVGTLHRYVEGRVRRWMKQHEDGWRPPATQVNTDGDSASMPLARCGAPPPPGEQISYVNPAGSALDAFGENGKLLWGKRLDGDITNTAVEDLDGDGSNEVIAAVGSRVLVFDARGNDLWTGETNAPVNYDGDAADGLTIRKLLIEHLVNKKRMQVIALSTGARGDGSRLTVFEPDGTLRGAYWHPGRLLDVVVAREKATSRTTRLILSGVNHALRGLLDVGPSVGCVLMFDAKDIAGEAPPYRGKLGTGTAVWYGIVRPTSQSIAHLGTVDRDHDGYQEIEVKTSAGDTLYLDFDGQRIPNGTARDVQFELLALR